MCVCRKQQPITLTRIWAKDVPLDLNLVVKQCTSLSNHLTLWIGLLRSADVIQCRNIFFCSENEVPSVCRGSYGMWFTGRQICRDRKCIFVLSFCVSLSLFLSFFLLHTIYLLWRVYLFFLWAVKMAVTLSDCMLMQAVVYYTVVCMPVRWNTFFSLSLSLSDIVTIFFLLCRDMLLSIVYNYRHAYWTSCRRLALQGFFFPDPKNLPRFCVVLVDYFFFPFLSLPLILSLQLYELVT